MSFDLEIKIYKHADHDQIEIKRPNMDPVATRFPHKSPVPHDIMHAIIETAFHLEHGFWGLIMSGMTPEEIAPMAKAKGHASASRPEVPDGDIVQLIHAERLVECFEADLWSGTKTELANLQSVFDAACQASKITPFILEDEKIAEVRNQIQRFQALWQQVTIGQGICVTLRPIFQINFAPL